MAGSRLANFGTIFSRLTGLLESGAVKDVPVWYAVYKKYPPEIEPYSDRPMPEQTPIPEIVYEEDFARANKVFVKEMTFEELEEKKLEGALGPVEPNLQLPNLGQPKVDGDAKKV